MLIVDMAKKTKPKHDGKLEVALKKHIKLVLLFNFLTILLLVLYVLLLQANLASYNDDSEKTKRLINAGIELDHFQRTLKDVGITSQTERRQFCWLSREKLGRGQIYCDQRLILHDKLSNEEDIAKLISNYTQAWYAYANINAQGASDDVILPAKNGLNRGKSEVKISDSYCVLDYAIMHNDFWRARDHGMVDIDITCSEEKEEAIYPVRDNTDY